MKASSELTRLGRVRKFRNLAGAALEAFGLVDARLEFLTIAGNVLFRVYESSPTSVSVEDYPFKPGQYLLRIHAGGAQTSDAIALEMEWLTAIRRDLGLSVPEPMRASDGNLLVHVSTPVLPESYDCTLLRWLRGRRITQKIQPRHFQAQGRVIAQLHNHAAGWIAPAGLTKQHFDYDGFFRNDAGAGLPNSDAWALLQQDHRSAYEEVARRVKLVMDNWGKHGDVYGLIHGDCGVDCNVLFWRGEAQIIDFDDSRYGYYLYDLAVALEHCWEEPDYPRYLESLLNGYTEFRPLADEQLRQMDLFRAAFYVYMGLWTVAMDKTYPNSPNKPHRHRKWIEYGMRFIRRYLDHS